MTVQVRALRCLQIQSSTEAEEDCLFVPSCRAEAWVSDEAGAGAC